jgi:hypothetical protein
MSVRRPRLYDLLPAYVRFRDAYEGEPLRTVMDTLEVPFQVIRDDIDNLYRAWFIETCDEWMVPYIGDLVGVRGLETQRQMLPTQRTRVANMLAYTRSKGTVAALERVARDVTGWPCHIAEHSQGMAGAASVLDPARVPPKTVDLRQAGSLDGLGGPFDSLAHAVDLKPADATNPPLGDRGGFHPLHLGLSFWRLESYPVLGGTPCAVEGTGGRGFRFHPFGLDIPLFNPPQTADGPVYRSSERNLPVRLRAFPLAEEIAARRRGELPSTGFFAGDPVFRILIEGETEGTLVPVPVEAIEVCDLSSWTVPGGDSDEKARVFVDPVLGRFLLAEKEERHPVLLDYSYGLSMDLGGGPYPREMENREPVEAAWKAVVSRDCAPGFDARNREHHFNSLVDAVDAWSSIRALPIPARQSEAMAPRSGIIRIHDSATYEGDIRVSLKGRWLTIQAADGCCPCVRGDIQVVGALQGTTQGWSDVRRLMAIPGEDPTLQNQLRLDGLWIEGGVRVRGGASLLLEHCTIAPPFPGRQATNAVRFEAGPGELDESWQTLERSVVRASRCILGALDLGHRPVELELTDCIVDGGDGSGGRAIAGERAAAVLARCTIFGEVRLDRLPMALSVLFRDPLHVAVPSEGELRFCHVPPESVTPTQERCQDSGAAFTSVTFGNPAYAQLDPSASAQIRLGGDDGNEIGVYNSLRQADRLANLSPVLDEFLPWGLSARVSFVT